MTTTQVAIILSGLSCEPDQITQALGLQPTETFRKGDPIGRGPRTVTSSAWRLDAPETEGDLAEQLNWLLERLPTRLDEIASVTQGWRVQFAIVVESTGPHGPPLAFSVTHLGRLAELEASIDISLRCL